jgi:thioredoxin-dependent peroxiredoxin
MVSVDTPEDNLAFARQEEADFPMLSDPTKATAAAYGVLGPIGFARRWTFYIGPDGRLLDIDKAVSTATAGQDVMGKLRALGVRAKAQP